LAALRWGRLGCAAIDVYSDEPLAAAHPIRTRDLIDAGKLLLTPHIGYVSRWIPGKQLEAWAKGEPIRELRS
jgi:phosphoglycerate dehydrogenase-like enzyme